MAKGRRKGNQMKKHATGVADLKPHPEHQLDTILRRQRPSGNCAYSQLPSYEGTGYSDNTQRIRSECELINSPDTIPDGMINSQVEQCKFEDGMGDFTQTLQSLELKEMHLRTLLGDKFNEKSFDIYRQNIINSSIRMMQVRTSNHVNEISSIDTSNQKEEINEDIFSQIESNGSYRQELLSEIRARLVSALMNLKQRKNELLLS